MTDEAGDADRTLDYARPMDFSPLGPASKTTPMRVVLYCWLIPLAAGVLANALSTLEIRAAVWLTAQAGSPGVSRRNA